VVGIAVVGVDVNGMTGLRGEVVGAAVSQRRDGSWVVRAVRRS
jgi:hypothetical protein